MGSCARIVQRCKNAWWTFFLDEVADNLVVKIFDRIPLDLFPNVFFLLSLEGELNKNLLQLFVYIVDAQLFE